MIAELLSRDAWAAILEVALLTIFGLIAVCVVTLIAFVIALWR